MQRFVHRAGVGVIAWRQGATSSAAGTLAPADRHRRLVSRGRVVRVAAGYGVVSGAGNATATPASISLTAPTGTADASGAGFATGSLAGITLEAITGLATGAAQATTTPAAVSLTAPTGTASSDTSGNAFAAFMDVVLTPVTGLATGGASAFGGLDAVTLVAPTGTASGSVTATIGRPTSDTSNTGWTASTGTDLYAMVDEVTPSAVDYISASSVGAVCEMALNPTAYPGTASQNLKFNASSTTGHSVIVRIKNGATIRTETQALTAVDTTYTITLTSGEIAAITSGALSVELESA